MFHTSVTLVLGGIVMIPFHNIVIIPSSVIYYRYLYCSLFTVFVVLLLPVFVICSKCLYFFNILLILIFFCFSISVFCLVPAFSLFLLYSVHSSILYLYCVPVYCSLSCILWSPLLDSPFCQFLSA